MSKTITTTKHSLLELTESIQLKDVITFQINSEVPSSINLVLKPKFCHHQVMPGQGPVAPK
jgi:hypothetical protein